MNLIERESLLKEIDNQWKNAHRDWYKTADYSPYEDGYNRARLNDLHILSEIVLAAPSVWHKAEDKPDRNTDIFIYFFDNDIDGNLISNCILHGIGKYMNYQFVVINEKGIMYSIQDERVIAWMYMPEPPKEFYPEDFLNKKWNDYDEREDY